ncbi:exodeoxyribonuclease VII large subunit [Oceanobacillus alkalisoli]|uniref:exodeoxyribonuclease VII large subunit n=1 Tax=Oceanobacillus alkalisoli TaxID=2925113 RepID=UPI001EF02490|nr:exodeoxyribonuclease VII large subunit [Oceanobacillus alkalisoli]MCF3941728.1 exodeoxyribonuclease VII large subunit [Oceanobacillus alkalisoli]MCG5103009.1 exodeoxyribonuclease VII large subunit [Oceanobacillus alkalisoli]
MKDKYLTVTALTRYLKRKLDIDQHLQQIWLRGEISNFKHHSRGHMYMTIKDEQTRIQAVMFAGNNRYLKFVPESGMKVLIRGNVSVYEAAGQYQLYINAMEPDGIGALYLAYEQLKTKLEQQGYFSSVHKKQIPPFPKRIGVITSPTGAAVRDIITTIQRRYPLVEVVVIPVLVQGPEAAASIKQGIEIANRMDFDSLIVGRGGGSIEELWSFNEEIVAHAIYESQIPVISAVGHETDTTISDFVADLRAPTPTGAAELAVPSQAELKNNIVLFTKRITREVNQLLDRETRQLHNLRNSYAFRYPKELIRQKEQELDQQMESLERTLKLQVNDAAVAHQTVINRLALQHPKERIEEAEKKLVELTATNNRYMNQTLDYHLRELGNLLDKLSLVNPLEIMKRGFALPYTADGQLLKSVKHIKEHEQLSVKLTDGTIDARVLSVKETSND